VCVSSIVPTVQAGAVCRLRARLVKGQVSAFGLNSL
jgi:hypothetical protein